MRYVAAIGWFAYILYSVVPNKTSRCFCYTIGINYRVFLKFDLSLMPPFLKVSGRFTEQKYVVIIH